MIDQHCGAAGANGCILLLVIQILFLAGIAGFHYSTLWYGKEIRVQTVPVDPRDLLYGDYVHFNYDINRVPMSFSQETGHKLKSGDRYMSCTRRIQRMRIYKAKAVFSNKPSRCRTGRWHSRVESNIFDNESIRILMESNNIT